MKTLKKSLAVFLSVLMTLSMCSVMSLVAFAETEFALLPTADGDALADGDYWFCLDDLLGYYRVLLNYSEENLDTLRNMRYYLGADDSGKILKIVRPDDIAFKYYEAQDSDALYFNCLRQHGVEQFPGWHEIPNADSDALTDGDYWFDLEEYILALGMNEAQADLYRTYGEYYLKDDASEFIIKIYAGISKNTVADSFYATALHQHGEYVPVFSQIPTAYSDDLATGDYWFDAYRYAIANAIQSFNATVWLSDNHRILRFMDGNTLLLTVDVPENYVYLRQVGEYDTWTELPGNDEGLAPGAYWCFRNKYDLENDPLEHLYLSPDASVLVMITEKTIGRYPSGHAFFSGIYQAGAWGERLPFSDEGLTDGEFWFDNARFTAENLLRVYYDFDNDIITVVNANYSVHTYPRDSGAYWSYVYYIRHVGEFESDFWEELPLSAEGLEAGDAYFDAQMFNRVTGIDDEVRHVYRSIDGDCYIFFDNNMMCGTTAEEYLTYCLKQVTAAPEGFYPFAENKEDIDENGGLFFDWYAFAASQAGEGATEEEIGQTLVSLKNYMELYWTLDEETYEPVVLARYYGYELLLDPATAPLFTSETPVAEADFDPDAAGMSYAEYTAIYDAAMWLAQKQAEDPENFPDGEPVDEADFDADAVGMTYEEYTERWALAQDFEFLAVAAELYYMVMPFVDYNVEVPAEGYEEDPAAPTVVFGMNDFAIPENLPDDVTAEDLEPVFNAAPLDEEELPPVEAFAGKKIAAFDLSFDLVKNVYDEGEIISSDVIAENVQPAENRNILAKLPVPDDFDPDNTCVYFIDDDGTTEEIPSKIVNGKALFMLRHCSVYALVDLGDSDTPTEPPVFEGFTLLPTADSDDLADGDYWFDLATFIADQIAEDPDVADWVEEYFGNSFFYLSDDGATARLWDGAYADDIPVSEVQAYLRQHAGTETCTHENMQAFPEVASTCQTPGNDAYWYCPDCETYFADAAGETEIEADSWIRDIDDTNHTPAEAVKENDTPSTCKALGSYESVVYCNLCGDELSRETVNYTEYAAHTPKDAVKENDTPSTCKALGSYDSVVYCNVCGDELSRDTVNYTEYAAHTPAEAVKENAVAATCTEAGSYEEVICCAVCDEEISRTPKTVAAAGHQWGEWTVTKEATETEKGEKTRECSICHETQTEEIPVVSVNRCKWCNEVHDSSFIGRITAFFHNIIYFFAHLFGKK